MAKMVTAKIEEREQLYMLEFLVSQLRLSDEKVEKNGRSLAVHIRFLDFSHFVIKQEDSSKNDDIVKFGAGESCVFSKKPRDLINLLQSNPLIIEIHKLNDDPCPKEPQNAICSASLELSGCFCQIEAAIINPHQLPEPYTTINTYTLLDDTGRESGSIELFLRHSCLGESIVTHFHVNDDAFLFKNNNSIDEFSCTKLAPMEDEVKNKFWTPKSKVINREKKPDTKIVVGISSICEYLPKKSKNPIIPQLSLEKLEKSSGTNYQNIQIENTDESANLPQQKLYFDSDKKLNNELTKKSSENLRRKSKFDSKTFVSPRKFPCFGKSCIKGLCSGISSSADDILPQNIAKSLYKPRVLEKRRLRGGTDINWSTIPIQSMQTLLSGACRTYVPSEDPRPGCGCQESSGKPKKNCCGIDCLIRSFNEAEKFVESIGRVPGLAGLGLIDPSESPFFGRRRPKLPTKCRDFQRPANGQPSLSIIQKSSSMLRAPRKLPSDKLKSTLPAIRKLKHEDLPEKTIDSELTSIKEPQIGPCGEPICKSRKKQREGSEVSSKENTKSLKLRKLSLILAKRKGRKLNLQKARNLRNYERNYGHVKVGKRIMRMVEASSQKGCYGHRSCVEIRLRVPGNMGWLWNTSRIPGAVKPLVGWRPGAISRGVWRILEKSKAKDTSEELEERRVPVKGRKGKMSKSKSFLSIARNQRKRREMEDGPELPPTLHVHRKNGDYYVTMHPVRPEDSPEIQQEVRPLQFKVTRNRNGENDGDEASSIGDDMEIEFSPPCAIHRPQKIVNRKDVEVQVVQQDILGASKAADTRKKKKATKK